MSPRGQEHIDWVTAIERIIEPAIARQQHIDPRGAAALEQRKHDIAGMVLTACFARLEALLGERRWKAITDRNTELRALREIGNAVIHKNGHLKKIREKKGLRWARYIQRRLSNGKIRGFRGQRIAPYFQVDRRGVVGLSASAIRRVRALYLQVLESEGLVVW